MYLCSDVFDGLVVSRVASFPPVPHVTVVFSPGRLQEKPLELYLTSAGRLDCSDNLILSGCASRAATATAGTSTGTATKPTVTESAARASVCLAGTHDTHADVHWIADSGATSHMSTQRCWFKTFKQHVVPIRVANNAIVYREGIGSIVMELLDKSLDPVCLSCVLYVPALQNNLFAVLHLVTSTASTS
jgi:hypothetical protein